MNQLVALSNQLLFASIDPSLSAEEREAATAAANEIADAAFESALADFRGGTFKFLSLSEKLLSATAAFGNGSGKIDELFLSVARLQAELHDTKGMRTTWRTEEEFEADADDEAAVAPTDMGVLIPDAPAGVTRLTKFTPIDTRDFAALETEYLQYFLSMEWRSREKQRQAQRLARSGAKNRRIYERVVAGSPIPWWFVAAIHLLESTFNFGTHLHNGDTLDRRTFRVPAGRPQSGNPPFDWHDSARDAMDMKGFFKQQNWSLARALHRWEAYNGFGYRSRGVPTPYLWSFTKVYAKGKFVGDGVFDANAVSQQCGAAAFLKALIEIGEVGELPKVEIFAEPLEEALETDAVPKDALLAAAADRQAASAHIDGTVGSNPDFRQFFNETLPDIRHFTWDEFLVKGASHRQNQLNTDPPQEKWENVILLARVLDELRRRIGHPIVLTSVYRSPEYNAAIGGAGASQHMQFRAADFVVPGHGTPQDWYRVANELRDGDKFFSGWIGLYPSFVHVDTRGWHAQGG